jgi:Methylenetetrahydrofolate reductase
VIYLIYLFLFYYNLCDGLRFKLVRKLKRGVKSYTGGSTSDLTLDLCRRAKEELHLNPNMHLTCTNMELEKVVAALEGCKSSGNLKDRQSVSMILAF